MVGRAAKRRFISMRAIQKCDLVVCVLLMLVPVNAETPATNAAAGNATQVFHDLFTLDCNGNAHFLPNHIFAARADTSQLFEAAEYFAERMLGRAQDACPELDRTEFVRDFVPGLPIFFNALRGKTDMLKDSKCKMDAFKTRLRDVFVEAEWQGMDLPSTCNYNSITTGKGCFARAPLSTVKDSYIQIAANTCSNSLLRSYISVTCAGPLCDTFMKPCSADNQCGKLRCEAVASLNKPAIDYESDIRKVAIDMDMLSEDLDEAGCITSKENVMHANPGSANKGLNIINSLMTYFRSFYDGKPWTAGELGLNKITMCGGSLLDKDKIKKNFFDPMGCVTHGGYTRRPLSCSNLKSWDGVLTDGTSVMSAERVSGDAFSTIKPDESACPQSTDSNIHGMLQVSCLGQLGVRVSQRLKAFLNVPNLPSLLDRVASDLKVLQDCRGNGEPYSDLAFLAGYIPWMPDVFFNRLTVHPDISLTREKASVSKPADTMLLDMHPNPWRLEMPQTCSFKRWADEGKCVAQYVGLSRLTVTSMKIQTRMEVCPANKFMPRMQVDCEGRACGLLQNAMPCSTDTDCANMVGGRNMICTNMIDELKMDDHTSDVIGGLLWPYKRPRWKSYWWSFKSNALHRILASLIPGISLGDFGTKNKNVWWYSGRSNALRSIYNFASTYDFGRCDDKATKSRCNVQSFSDELRGFLTSWQSGGSYSKYEGQSGDVLKFCTPDTHRIRDKFVDWKNTEYSISDDKFRLTEMMGQDVTDSTVPFCSPLDRQTSPNSNSPTSPSSPVRKTPSSILPESSNVSLNVPSSRDRVVPSSGGTSGDRVRSVAVVLVAAVAAILLL